MGISDRLDFARNLASFPKRIPSLPQSYRAAARGVAFLTLALLTGYQAWQYSASDALLSWQNSHRPSPEIWSTLLKAEGFQEVRNPKVLTRMVRTLPALVGPAHESEGASSWIILHPNGAPLWLARVSAPQEGAEGSPIRFFGRDLTSHEPTTGEWKPLGEGWAALEDFSALAKKKLPDIRPKKGGKGPASDPREIRF